MTNVSGAAARGGAVTILGQAAKLILLAASLVILSRLLSPTDFGVFGAAIAVIGISELLRDLGITAAAIQAATLSEAEKSNLFWINTGLGAALSALFLLLSPLISLLYQNEEVISALLALCALPIMNGVQAQFQVELVRSGRFGSLALSDVVGQAVGLIAAIILATSGFNYWSLVYSQLCAAGTTLALRAALSKWLPSRYNPKESVRSFLSFGWRLAVSQLLGYLAGNAALVSLGARSMIAEAGLYTRANQIATIPINQIFGPLTNVALGTLSRERNPNKFNRYIAHLTSITGLVAALGFSAIASFAGPIVALVLGERWLAAVPVLQWLSLAVMFQSLVFPHFWVFTARGRADLLLRFNISSKIFVVLAVAFGSTWGAAGAAAGLAVGFIATWPLCIWYSRTILGEGSRQVILASLRALWIFSLASVIGWITQITVVPQFSLFWGILAWCLAMSSALLSVGIRRDLRVLLKAVRNGFSR